MFDAPGSYANLVTPQFDPPVSATKIDVGTVSSPGCSKTIAGERFSPNASQNALPNALAPLNHSP